MSETKEYGDLMSLRNVAIVIPGPSGKVWHQQAGCVSCLHMDMEGWVEILWDVPAHNFLCDTGDIDRLQMKRDLEKHAPDVFKQIISIEGSTEAWLDIAFILTKKFLNQHPEIDVQPGEEIRGVLTWQNCD